MSANTLHPFPARMAPEIALSQVKQLPHDAVVLDPMAGSGTVLWHAAVAGHFAIGLDVDPLAVLISRVRTSTLRSKGFTDLALRVVSQARSTKVRNAELPWIDGDPETKLFIKYWFGKVQATQLRLLAHVLWKGSKEGLARADSNALKLVLSRLIITKKHGASLAWDVSHSRPHRAKKENEFDVLEEFSRSAAKLEHELGPQKEFRRRTRVYRGDSRRMARVADSAVDAVITSPPYLNAIDYLRGHKLSLIWLGHTIPELREIRSSSIGAERGVSLENYSVPFANSIFEAFGDLGRLSDRCQGMILRYAVDIQEFISEIVRVLRPGGKAVLVVGNSCLKNVFVRNSDAVAVAAKLAGLEFRGSSARELPDNSRYLPINVARSNSLGRRMKTETVMTFVKPTC